MKRGKRNTTLQVAAGVVTLAAAIVFADTAVGALWYAPEVEISAPELKTIAQEARPEDRPVRIRIPILDIDARVQEVGVNAKGNMASPSNFTDVGWYKYGTFPGFYGSAVIAGHVDNGLGLSGVFRRLSELTIGDDIYIEEKDGSETHFRVTEIQSYPYTRAPLSIIFSRRDLPRLNLITCEGDWISDKEMYDERLVVYSELVR